MSFPFAKGHGTHNDFVVLPDLDGSVHGSLHPSLVVALCDRRGGIGADGVLRVLRGQGNVAWYMDYRNADGSTAEMCGNGLRVFARYLCSAGLVDPSRPLEVDTGDGVKHVTFCDDGEISVDMGRAEIGPRVEVRVDEQTYPATAVDVGNPHVVVVVNSLHDAGDLRSPPYVIAADGPTEVNIEFVVRMGSRHLAMRVFERGVGETQSCGTGAVAVAAVEAALDGAAADKAAGQRRYRIDVPGGVLTATSDAAEYVHLKGPAVLVAEGTWIA